MILHIGLETDRLDVAKILVKNGYTVRQVTIKEGTRAVKVLEVEKNKKEN